MKDNLIILCLIFVMSFSVKAQQKLTLQECEDSIQNEIERLIVQTSDSAKFELNDRIIKMFREVLADVNSFNYGFEKLKNISKLNSTDGLIRIINWDIPPESGEFKYFGFIQYLDSKKKSLKLFQLNDQSEKIKNPQSQQLSDAKWFGALYYKLLTKTYKKVTYYTLFGWDGNNNFTNKKLIDVFVIQGNKVVFGPPVFKMENDVIQNRLIFEYAKQVKMMLRYDEKLDLVVWDHLAPAQPNFIGQYMYYGPDLSQDGAKFEKGFWVLKPNLDLRNMEKSTGKSIKKSF